MKRALAVLGLALLVTGTAGCQEGVVEYLDEIDFLPKREKLSEVSLGRFVIPVPAKEHESGIDLGQQKSTEPARNRLQILFEVFAIVSPRDESRLTREWERQQGRYRYEVIRICREATMDEVSEPTLATLKGRLIDMTMKQLETNQVRQIVLNGVTVREL